MGRRAATHLTVALSVVVGAGCSGSVAGDDESVATAAVPASEVTSAPTSAATEPSDTAAAPSSTGERTGRTIGSSVAPSTAPAVDESAPSPPTTASVSDAVTEADLARFVAATEAAIDETSLAGVVFESPEIYIALAQAACARFSEGADFDAVAAELLTGLASEPSEDVERLAGALLGAATRTICPEHADRV